MKKTKSLYHGHRFLAIAISCAVRRYLRFSLSLRDIEALLLERGVVVTYETIRCLCDKFGAGFAQCAKPLWLSTPMCNFMPKCHCLPLRV